MQRKARLRELGIFYKSRRQYLRQGKGNPACGGSFIQLGTEGALVPATVTEMARQVNPGQRVRLCRDRADRGFSSPPPDHGVVARQIRLTSKLFPIISDNRKSTL